MEELSARRYAFDILLRITQNKAYSNIELPNVLNKTNLSAADRAFCTALVLGTEERIVTLDYIIDAFSTTKSSKTELRLKNLLRMGIYQIFFMDRVPNSAACDESVELAKMFFKPAQCGYINAVLRNVCRNKEKMVAQLALQPLCVRYSVSPYISELLINSYGAKAEEILESFFVKSPLALRVNTLKTDCEKLFETLEEMKAEPVYGEVPDSLRVYANSGEVIKRLDKGEYYIQGIESQSAVKLLGAKRGEKIVDVCAAPGGKSFGAAIEMCNKGSITAIDLHGNKLSLIKKGAEALGIGIIKTQAADSRNVIEELVGSADRVICDVPCSGIGVISQKPEIRYKQREEIEALTDTQFEIIKTAASYLKPNGVLVYSTCTLNPSENGDIVQRLLRERRDAVLEYERTALPSKKSSEGFYMAKLVFGRMK